ncbi:type II toxin-antitoxin system CcdA family antitoxin [Photorhabdus sp. P32]|uniref:type II toxin-antitoxin system CcdA family antitoxin n=1 Tax=Photorhabdus sp. P32 TaxID=3117549 RepID=UPI00311AEBE2
MLSTDLIEQAKALDLNLSTTLNKALEQIVKERQRERRLAENLAGLEALNDFVEKNGLFSDLARLDMPVQSNELLRKTMQTPAPWDKA